MACEKHGLLSSQSDGNKMKMVAIHAALAECSAVIKRILTSCQNRKFYLAGAFHNGTGIVTDVAGHNKGSGLFTAC